MSDVMTPDELVALALQVSEEGMRAGELPVGAVVVRGEEVVGRAFTQERTQSRRLAHADLLAMERADRRLGWQARSRPLVLAVTLEPCLMCLGAAMALGVSQVYYGVEAPDDGAVGVAAVWRPVVTAGGSASTSSAGTRRTPRARRCAGTRRAWRRSRTTGPTGDPYRVRRGPLLVGRPPGPADSIRCIM